MNENSEQKEKWKIELYVDNRGKTPVQEFLDKLSETARASIIRDFKLLEEYGLKVNYPTVRPITSVRKLWELRTKTKDGATRIFYVAHTGRRFIMLHAFFKKSAKTPKNEIEIASKRLHEVLEKEEDNDEI